MMAIATLRLHIDIDQAIDMGLEINDPVEYAKEEFIEWVFEMTKHNDLEECIHIEIKEEE